MRTVVFQALVAVAAMLPIANAAAATPADKAMGDQIGLQLKESGRLRNYRIGVTYEDGVVWLDGTVTSAAQRETAASLAKQSKGVVHVINRLEIGDKSASKTDDLATAFKQSQPAAPAANNAGNPRQASATMAREGSAQNQSGAARRQPMPRGGNMPVPAGRMQANPIPMQGGGPRPQPASYEAPTADGMGMGMGPGMAPGMGAGMAPTPSAYVPGGGTRAVSHDNAQMPGYAWPSYASYPNYAALTYPQQYSPTAWPYIGPFYPYPQVPLAWRKVALEWDDGWWFLDFSAHNSSH